MISSEEEMFSFDVGLVDGRSRLNCCINVHEKSFRYYKSRRVLLAFDPALRLKRWALHRLRDHARPPRTHDAPFLPGQLLRGNVKAMPAFLQQLRTQKVESYIPLCLDRCREEAKGSRLATCLARIVRAVRSEGFRRIVGRKGKVGDGESHQGRKGRRGADTTVPGATNRSADSTPPGRSPRSLSITYTRITLPESRNAHRTDPSSLDQKKHKPSTAVSIRRLSQGSPGKVYTFEAGNRRWERLTPPKHSSFQF